MIVDQKKRSYIKLPILLKEKPKAISFKGKSMLKVAVQIQLIFEMVDTCLNTLYSLFSVSVVWGKVCPDINFNLLQIIAT